MRIENREYIEIRWKRFGFFCLFFYWFILIYLTLFTYNYYVYGRSFNLELFDSIQLMLGSGDRWLIFKNLIGNVLLFLPQGFLLPLLSRRCRSFFVLFVISAVTSFVIEISQYEYAKRIFDIDDVFLNVIGAMLGGLIAFAFRWILKEKARG